ncbi:MAG TPA: VWA domain-containing protein [Longimicrobiales bacterium]|nr:VWA domain-containing protein [Longimicrobiales bacterium]
MNTTLLLDHEPVEHGRVIRVLLRIQAEAPPQSDRLPLNLSLVLDRSGSMYGDKLAAARRAAAQLVRRLSPADVVSVVAYDHEVQTVAPPATGDAQADLPKRIEAMEAGGSTNLSGGWLRGRELVMGNRLDRGVNRVILLTDGLANHGITDALPLMGLAAQGKADGITTTTVGFGQNYDERLLRGMADAGGGNAYYIETTDQASAIFADELQGLLELGAQNVAVEVEVGSTGDGAEGAAGAAGGATAELVAVHHEYPSSQTADGHLRLELGDIYAREPKPLLVELLVRDDVAADVPVVTLVVTGDVLLGDGGMEHRRITLPVTVAASEGARIEPEVRHELLLLGAARARKSALEQQDNGNYDGAASTLRDAGRRLRAMAPFAGEAKAAEALEEAADLEALATSYDQRSVTAADAKYMYQRSYSRMSGRQKKAELIRRLRGD